MTPAAHATAGRGRLQRLLVLAYGVFAFAAFVATFAYAIGFIGNIVVPRSIDAAPRSGFTFALATNLGLLALFVLQHSVMARTGFKRWQARWLPPVTERSTYTLFSSLALIVLFVFWQPMGGVVWQLQSPFAGAALQALFATGWLLVLLTLYLLGPLEMFGLRQCWDHFRGRAPAPARFVVHWPYRLVRHPWYLGWLLAFWATPTMTAAHLVFALTTGAYVVIAIQFEERDLAAADPAYSAYRRRVPALLPRLLRRRAARPATPAAPASFPPEESR